MRFKQQQEMLAAREEHVYAGSGDVNPLMGGTFGTQAATTAWRVRHSGDQKVQPIRKDNFGSVMFKEPTEFSEVKGYTGMSPR